MKQEILSSLDIRAYFAHELNQSIPATENVNVYCPFHGEEPGKSNPSLSINTQTGVYNCFSCGAKGNIFDFYMQNHNCEFKDALQGLAKFAGVTLQKQPSQAGLTFPEKWERATSVLFPEAGRIYLHSRGIADKIIDDLLDRKLMGWNPKAWAEPKTFKPAIAFPMMDRKGEIVGIQHIFTDGRPKKNVGKSKLAKGFFRFGDGELEIITEAIIDAISAVQAFPGIAAIATFSSTSLQKLRNLDFANPPVLFFDNDPAGQMASQKATKLLEEVRVVRWAKDHAKDINELLKADQAELIRELIHTAETAEIVAPAAATAEIQNDLPVIQTNEIQLRDLTKHAWEAILEANYQPVLYRNSRGIVSLVRADDGLIEMREVSVTRMRGYLGDIANWTEIRHNQNYGDFKVSAIVPKVAAETVIAHPDPPLPYLKKIITAPVFAEDLSLTTTPGYSPETECYLQLDITVPDVPKKPTREQTRDATDWIDEVLYDFPLAGEAEKANAIAFFILPYVRNLIDGLTPLHLFEASTARTGKTLMVELLSYPFLGRWVSTKSEISQNDELRKQITSSLLENPAYVFFDNLNYNIDSGILAQAATSEMWEDRLLSTNRNIRVPVKCIWILSANNPQMSKENLGRTVRIRQDAKMEFPELRDPEKFRHSNIKKWVRDHRAELIWAALTLCQNWIAKSCPKPQDITPMGGFEEWRHVVGGILQAAEIPGFLENAKQFREDADDETATLRAFIATWRGEFGETPVTTKELFPMVQQHDIPLPIDAKTERGEKTKLGNLLKKLKDRRFTISLDSGQMEIMVRKTGEAKRAAQYQLISPENLCPKCAGNMLWKSRKDKNWHCVSCDPPDEHDIAEIR